MRDQPRQSRPAAGESSLASILDLGPIPRSWFERPSEAVAPDLLGAILVHDAAEGVTAGIIVETEAYGGPSDRASHARAGRTARTAPMFGPPGHAYVYLVYGMHSCLNVVTERDGEAGAVLLRALAPLAGADLMTTRRRRADPPARIAAGPARLCQAMGIDRRWNGADLTAGTGLWIARGPAAAGTSPPLHTVAGPRIGVDYAGEDWAARAWRFGIEGHASLSRPFPPRAPVLPAPRP